MKRRSLFSLSHFKLFTGKMGYLYPVACMEALPGDTFQMSTSIFLRFSPMVAPVMTPVTVKVHHWFVPTRLIWEDFEDMITGGPDGTSVPIPPYFVADADGVESRSVQDYLGIPPGVPKLEYSALPQRALNLIYNEWYRDQNLQSEKPLSTASGLDTTTEQSLFLSPWDKDYFTSASPYEQKGAAVNVPINLTSDGEAPLITALTTLSGGGVAFKKTGTPVNNTVPLYVSKSYSNPRFPTSTDNDGAPEGVAGSIDLTFTRPTASTVVTWNGGPDTQGALNLNAFREGMAMQRFEEHRMLYGSRYTEYLRYLGVKASDGRLQRPEYLGGGRSIVQFSEVLQTAADGDTPVGTMRGHGIGAMRTNRFRRFFEEHGYVITLMSIRPKSIYTQGLNRMFSRKIKTDWWQSEFEHLGQQEIQNKEIYAASSDPNGTFGYQDRYNEYRTHPSYVAGEFRDLLNYWHLGREFESDPVLNSDFISSLPTDRVFADQTGNDTLYIMANNSVQARRLISKKGTPR